MSHKLLKMASLTLGNLLVALAVTCFIVPHGLVLGGSTGIALIVTHAAPLPLSLVVFVINVALFLLGAAFLGHSFAASTIFSTIAYPLAMSVLETLPLDQLTQEPMLAAVCAGALMGAGAGLILRAGGSTGGTDIVAMIINKYRTVSYGKILIFSDFVIIGSSMLVGFHIDTVIYGYVMTAVVGYTVDMIMAGNQQSSQVLIVTHDYEKMADAIANNIHRGVTLIDSEGWYSKEKSKVVMVVCRKRETSMILKFAKTIDPDAFMTVGSVMGVYGKGFEALNKL